MIPDLAISTGAPAPLVNEYLAFQTEKNKNRENIQP
jgi:hypothetical protein